MSTSLKKHRVIASLVNLIAIFIILSNIKKINDSHAIILFVFYILLILVNSLVWVILKLLKKKQSEIYGQTTLMLIVLFIPLLILAIRL